MRWTFDYTIDEVSGILLFNFILKFVAWGQVTLQVLGCDDTMLYIILLVVFSSI